jgi:hypothetical protein
MERAVAVGVLLGVLLLRTADGAKAAAEATRRATRAAAKDFMLLVVCVLLCLLATVDLMERERESDAVLSSIVAVLMRMMSIFLLVMDGKMITVKIFARMTSLKDLKFTTNVSRKLWSWHAVIEPPRRQQHGLFRCPISKEEEARRLEAFAASE